MDNPLCRHKFVFIKEEYSQTHYGLDYSETYEHKYIFFCEKCLEIKEKTIHKQSCWRTYPEWWESGK